jgi:hypothetical protein
VCYTHVGKRSTLERCDEATLVMSKKSDHCANCNTERYGIYRRGYCEFCYRLIVQKEEVERWDLKDPSTLKRVPGIASYSQRRFEEEFPKIKAARLKELEYRLWLRKTKEAQRNKGHRNRYRTRISVIGQIFLWKGTRCLQYREYGERLFRSTSAAHITGLAVRY